MGEKKPIEEVREMHSDAQYDYLIGLDEFTEEEWELYKGVQTDDYHMKEIARRSFEDEDGRKYLISVERWSDGVAPDEMNTRINVVKINSENQE